MMRDISLPTTWTHLGFGRCPMLDRGRRDRSLGLCLFHVLLVRDLSLEVHELSAIEALANGPLQHVTISGDGDEIF